MRNYFLLGMLLVFLTSGMQALPDASQEIWYYDGSGNLIGWFWLTCNGQRQSGGSTSDVYEIVLTDCFSLEPLSCNDNGLNALSGCDGWCYSDGYVMSYNNDLVANCAGLCACGEFEPCSQLGPTCITGGKGSRSPSVMRAHMNVRAQRSNLYPPRRMLTQVLTQSASLSKPIYRMPKLRPLCNRN